MWKLNGILKKESPDCVISFGSTSLTLVTILKKIRGYKTIYSERSDPNYCARTLSDKIRYYCYNYADKMVFQVPGVRDYFNEKIRKRSVIIPNPVGIPVEQWQLEGTKDIVCVARMEMRQKRHDVLFLAFKKVLSSLPEVKLHLYGDGGDMQTTKELADEMGISEQVCFHGNIKNVTDKIGAYRVSVLTSDYEGMPNTLLEAMALGMPVVATDCSPGGAAYLIENGENGILVPRGDANAVADALLKVLKDDNFSIKIGRAARERIKLQSYERNKEEWLNLIREVLKS
jgi:glycosyltransferase involved in cell wall biosynthesis